MASRFSKRMSGQIPGIAGSNARHVPETSRRQLEQDRVLLGDPARLIHERTGEQVGHVACDRDQPVVIARVNGDDVRAELSQDPVKRSVRLRLCVRRGRQHPGAALKEVAARPASPRSSEPAIG